MGIIEALYETFGNTYMTICIPASVIFFIGSIIYSKYFGEGMDGGDYLLLVGFCVLLYFITPIAIAIVLFLGIGSWIVDFTNNK